MADRFSQALRLFEQGKPHLQALQEHHRLALKKHEASGVVKAVEILTAGKDSCPACRRLQGKRFTIKQALKEMPLPVRGCTNWLTKDDIEAGRTGWCRCTYISVLDVE